MLRCVWLGLELNSVFLVDTQMFSFPFDFHCIFVHLLKSMGTETLPTIFKISSFVFSRRNKVIQVWNDMNGVMVDRFFICGWTIKIRLFGAKILLSTIFVVLHEQKLLLEISKSGKEWKCVSHCWRDWNCLTLAICLLCSHHMALAKHWPWVSTTLQSLYCTSTHSLLESE